MNKLRLIIFLSTHFLNDIFELGTIHFIIYLSGLIATYIYRYWLFSKLHQLWNRIEKVLGKNTFKQYKIDDLIFEYYPIFNNWKASITILSHNDIEVVKVISDEFPLDPIFSHGKKIRKGNFQNSDRVRLNNYKTTLNGKLKVTFQKTKYINYLDSNEHLEELYHNQNRTYRDVLLAEIEKGDIEDFPLTNICGAGIFSITKDNKLIISKHSGSSKVYPNIYTFTASGVLNWVDNKTNANPFRGMSEIYSKKIGHDINESEIKMIGFGADARKLYFQFSFFENSSLSSEDLELLQMSKNISLPEEQRRQLVSIPFKLDRIIESLFIKIWEPAAEVALLTYCVKEFGRKEVLKTLKMWEACWQERNTRNEFEYRCASREGYSADLTTSIPKKELDQISNKNIEQVFSFIGKETITEKTILEIGCGTGRITRKLLDCNPMEISCIEVSPCMMNRHEEINSDKIFRETKYFQLWEPIEKGKRFQIAICSLVLIHNKEFEVVVEKLCFFVTEKIFVVEDVTNPLYRKRPISQYTFLRKKDEIVNSFNKFGWQLKKSSEHTLYEDKLIFLEFNLAASSKKTISFSPERTFNISRPIKNCQISFTSHRDASVITISPIQMEGIANVPIGGHLWILCHIKGFNGWWPQGNGQRFLSGDKWICAVFLGIPGETGDFEVAAVIVNDQEHDSLMNWVNTAQQNSYPPRPFPDSLQECSIVMITVNKQ